MSVLRLPEPIGWSGGRPFLTVAVVAAFGVAGFYAYMGVQAATRGNLITAAVTVGWVVFLLAFSLAVLLVRLGCTTAQTTSDTTGFTVWPDRRFSVLALVGLLASIPSCLLFAIAAPMGVIEFANTKATQGIWAGSAAFAAIVAIVGLITAWRRGGIGHVKLTPAMIENADIVNVKPFEWDTVIDVVDRAEKQKTRRAVVLKLRDGGEEIINVADIYLPRGAALYWLVRHYWKHPEDRPELVDARAAERLREGRFDLD